MCVCCRLVEKFSVHAQLARAEALESLTDQFLSHRLHSNYAKVSTVYIHCISPAWQSLGVLVAQLVEHQPRN